MFNHLTDRATISGSRVLAWVRWLPVALIGGQLTLGMLTKVHSIPADAYARIAVEIRVADRWRYGYVCGQHGAVLVKTRNGPSARPGQASDPSAELTHAMLAELQGYPRKCVLETLLYAVILVYALGLAPRLRRWVNHRFRSWPAALLSESAVWIGGWTLITGPLLILGYGSSIYTTWAGPGWLSCSGPYLGMPTGFAGESVSYRPFLEALSAFPLLAIPSRGFGPLAEYMRLADYVWMAGAIFWGAVGAVAGGLIRASTRRGVPLTQEAREHAHD